MTESPRPLQGLILQCFFWVIGLGLFVWFLMTFGVIEQLGFDAGHATSVARNLIAGNGLRTSIISNDALFGQQIIPAIQTIWPPGMPMATAVLHIATGTAPAMGFVWINAASHLLTAALVVTILGSVGVRWPVAMAAGFVCLMTVPNWILIIRGHSEPPMAALSVLLCLLTTLALRSNSKNRMNIWVLTAIVVAVLCFLVRYQAIALLGPLTIIALISLTGRIGSNSQIFRSATIGASMLVVATAYIGSNILIAGSVTGSDSPFNGRTLSEVADALDLLPRHFRQPVFIIQLVGIIVLAAFTLALTFRQPRTPSPHHKSQLVVLLFSSFTIVSIVLMLAMLTFMTPAYPWIARYFVPMLPMLLMTIVMMMMLFSRQSESAIQSKRAPLVLSAIAVIIALGSQLPAANLIEHAKGKAVETVTRTSPQVATLLGRGSGLAADSPRVLMSNHAAFLALWTEHAVLGTPFPDSDKPAWDERRVAQTVQAYGVTHVIVFAEYPEQWGRNDLADVVGENPNWLAPAFGDEFVTVYNVLPNRSTGPLSEPHENKAQPRKPSLARKVP